MSLFRRLFLHSPKTYIAAAALNLLLCLIVLLVRGFDLPIYYFDALTISGSVSILFGLLMLVAHQGSFDIFGYAFSMLRNGGSDPGLRRDRDLYGYRERKKEERSKKELTFMPFIVVGAVFLLAGAVLWRFI